MKDFTWKAGGIVAVVLMSALWFGASRSVTWRLNHSYPVYPTAEAGSPQAAEALFKLPAEAREVISITKNRNGDWIVGYHVDGPMYKAIQYGPGDQSVVTEFRR